MKGVLRFRGLDTVFVTDASHLTFLKPQVVKFTDFYSQAVALWIQQQFTSLFLVSSL